MRAVLDTSVLVAGEAPPEEIEAAISVASITELHFGLLVAPDDDERARRANRLATVEAAFDPLPVSVEVAVSGASSLRRSRAEAATLGGVRSTSPSRRPQSSSGSRCSPTTWRTSS